MTHPPPPAVETPLVPEHRPGTRVAFVASTMAGVAAILLSFYSNRLTFEHVWTTIAVGLAFVAAERTVFHVCRHANKR